MPDDEDDTEYKLAELKKITPDADLEMLLEVLLSCEGDLTMAKGVLEPSGDGGEPASKPDETRTTSRPCGVNIDTSTSPRVTTQITLKRFLGSDNSEANFKVNKHRLTQKGKTLHLYDPDDVQKLLPCTMHLSVFPKELANTILSFLMKDSESWPQNTFHLFDREVSSAHSTGIYTDNEDVFQNRVTYTYNGSRMKNFRMFTDEMKAAKYIIEDIVNKEIKKRGLLPYQHPKKWQTDLALCNRYDGPASSVGFHSDQLTHLGPHCVIASISLGVTREFRLKSRTNKEAGPISIHLPHNSLIIMHAGCQEDYKHSIMPSFGRPLDPHPISGGTRINITYRMYLEAFKEKNNPECECNKPMILRAVTNSSSSPNQTPFEYIWMCGSSYSGDPNCSKTVLPSFPVNNTSSFEHSSDSGSCSGSEP